MESLNERQCEAVHHTHGPLLILAGAGSGKTRTITFRISYLIAHGCAPPENILAVTFTNKAASEMKERVMQLLSGRSGNPLVCTFHSFAVRVLRRHIDRLGYTRDFTIYDDDDQKAAIKAILKEQQVDETLLSHRRVHSMISYAKNHSVGPKQYLENSSNREMEMIGAAYIAYQEFLKKSNVVDFDDLILLTSRLLRENADLLQQYNQWYRYLMVDEYQDTNRPQYELIKLLTTYHDNICVVGDEDQSIYRFRGADIRNILSFENDFPGTRVIKLEQNYRSTQNILNGAAAVVSQNKQRKGKTLWTDNPTGKHIQLYEAEDAQGEADFVTREIAEYLDFNPESRVAVLYRTNFQSRQFEEALRRRSLPYKIVGSVGFYARAEIKDIIAYLKVLLNPHDGIMLARIINVPGRGIGKATVDRLAQIALLNKMTVWQALEKSLREQFLPARTDAALNRFHNLITTLQAKMGSTSLGNLLQMIAEHSGYMETLAKENTDEAQSRILNINELVNAAHEADSSGQSIQEFLDHAALSSDSDDLDLRARITLLTMHNAKGLEFPVVFIVGCEEGLFPHIRSNETAEDLEEERRLCYVAMTRAQRKLYITYARMRRMYGGDIPGLAQPSRFIAEIPTHLLETRSAPDLPRFERFRPHRTFTQPRYAQPSVLTPRIPKSYGATTHDNVDAVRKFIQEKYADLPSVPEPAMPARGHRMKPGTKVFHEKYGLGVVIDREKLGDDFKLTVSFAGIGQKKLMERFAKLKKM
ncbi:MAG: UvrD-helicase domain-containing protein [Acidobacteria bacterium]|nr:UvrD-helicase domain-containing protein [Acidobacteriota bacterium]